jgi:hypothetical protein
MRIRSTYSSDAKFAWTDGRGRGFGGLPIDRHREAAAQFAPEPEHRAAPRER